MVALAVVAVAGCASAPEPVYDWIVRGGTVVDGRGGAPLRADVGAIDGRIAAIGALGGAAARRTIDATGLWVTPGFVDLHSHADLILLSDPATQSRLLEAKIRQGVTTVVVGNCGLGPTPSDDRSAPILAAINAWMTPEGVVPGPSSLGGYLDRLEVGGVAVNVATLAPHGPIRIAAVGLAPGAADPGALAAMVAAVEDALDDGAYGLSVGLIYPPGMYSPPEELVALAAPVAQRDRLFTAHIRGSSETLLPATRELIEIGRSTGVRVHHSHLEAVGERFFDDIDGVLALEDEARREGVRITHDMFPYERAATMMAAIFPPWSLEGGLAALVERLRDPATRERIRVEIETRVPEWPPWIDGGWPHNLVEAVGWDGILVASVGPGGPQGWIGRSLADIAIEHGARPFDVVADLMIDQGGRVGQMVAEVSALDGDRGQLDDILRHEAAALVSDAEDYGHGTPHPAHAGAFARGLRLAREGLMPLEEMVRRTTSYPASIVGLEDRGTLRVGAFADVVVFDPDQVHDRAGWEHPREVASGIPWVAIGGSWVVDEGLYVGGLAGRVLRARMESHE